jgi:hypothetical protein
LFVVASGSLEAAIFASVAGMAVVFVTIVIASNLAKTRRSLSRNSTKVNQSLALHGQAAFELALASFPCRDQFTRDVWAWLRRKRAESRQSPLHPAITRILDEAALAVYDWEVPRRLPRFVEPGVPGSTTYETKIEAIIAKCANPEAFYDRLVEAVGASFFRFELEISRRLDEDSLAGPFVAPLSHLVRDLPAILHASFVEPHRGQRVVGVPARASDVRPDVIARTCRLGTLLAKLSEAEVSFSPPDWARLGHHWVVAPEATHRRCVLSAMLAADTERVLRGEASVVVVDGSGELTREISRLKVFARGQPLHDKLTLIEPNGVDPLAFSLFRGLRAASNGHQRHLHLELAHFALTSLFGPRLSPLQRAIIRYAAELLLALPNPSLSALQEMLTPGRAECFRAHFLKLSPAARAFFERGHGNQVHTMRAQADLLTRLKNALLDPRFSAPFSQAEDRLDLGDQITRSKVVVVNTSQLSAYAAPFVNFFIAAALTALSRRCAPEIVPAPTFFYIEDIGRYVAHEQDARSLFDLAGANDVGLVFSTGAIGQIRANVREALSDVSIITASQLNAQDASFLAPKMQASLHDLSTFAREDCLVAIRGHDQESGPVSARLLKGRLELMSDAEFADLRPEMQNHCMIRPYRRQHDPTYDLCWEATLSPRTAKRGGKLKVDNLLITIVAGTTDGTVLRLKGKGVPKPDRTRGNLYITVNVPQLPAKRAIQPGAR